MQLKSDITAAMNDGLDAFFYFDPEYFEESNNQFHSRDYISTSEGHTDEVGEDDYDWEEVLQDLICDEPPAISPLSDLSAHNNDSEPCYTSYGYSDHAAPAQFATSSMYRYPSPNIAIPAPAPKLGISGSGNCVTFLPSQLNR